MAKKKQNLSPEELLAQALVPEQKWPYGVPDNWVWTRLDNVAKYKKGPFGSSITKAMFVPKGKDTYKIYEQGNAIRKDKNYGNYYITIEKYNELKGFKVDSGDLIVSCAGTIGETYLLPDEIEPGIINQALMKINVNEKISLPYYLMYFDQILREDITGSSKGTAIKNIPPFSVLKNILFPLPPLAEQQRIVDRIESLFEKLDQAKGLIQDALDSFENRKSAILHKAFSGELTRKWREENGVGMESWKQFKLKDVCSIPITDGTHQTPTYCSKEDGGIPFISAKDVTTGKINWGNIKFITPELHVKLYERVAPQIDDVLLAKNGTTGIAAMVETDKVFDIYVTLALLRPNKEVISPKYLLSVINSPNSKSQFNEHLTGIGVPNLHLRDIRVVDIDVPSIDEQHEIVRLLENLIVNEEQSRDLLFETYEKIELMKKAVLSRAFRGELGTNDPSEKSSKWLLGEVLSMK